MIKQKGKLKRLIEKSQKSRQLDVDNTKERWVVNLSNKQLSESQKKVLEHGLNFSYSLSSLPVDEIITAVEIGCKSLEIQKRNECKGKIASIMKSHKSKKSNITPEERLALKSLKEDKDITILPADKGRATVIMNSTEYREKAKQLLSDKKTYDPLPKDPTKEYKAQLKEKLTKLVKEKKMDRKKYLQLMPTAEIHYVPSLTTWALCFTIWQNF